MYFIDIHCHLLPALDDGAFYDDEAVRMAEQAYSAQTQCIVCTPHNKPKGNYSLRTLLETFHRVCNLLKSEQIPVKLFLGQEIFLGNDYRATISSLKKGELLTINRSAYPLVEFSPTEAYVSVCKKIDALCAEGFVPIVAHPERYRFVQNDPNTALGLKKHGAVLQVNKGSLEGTFGDEAEITILRLLDMCVADILASDAHSPYVRTTPLRDTHEWLSERCSHDYANLLLFRNPQNVLKNLPLK